MYLCKSVFVIASKQSQDLNFGALRWLPKKQAMHTHSLSHTTHTRSHTQYTLAHTHSTHSLTHTTPTRSHTQHTRSLRLQLVKNTRSHSICCECVGVPGKHACTYACKSESKRERARARAAQSHPTPGHQPTHHTHTHTHTGPLPSPCTQTYRLTPNEQQESRVQPPGCAQQPLANPPPPPSQPANPFASTN